ncbi:hypothetical protein HMPREF1250_0276 [Megasphaera vaginalis (ex Srinivasan et al. 2021)]|uniref:Uncharacterized protein n=1 Tax=Megasphaera vaginalis (ex Srinivasan et al. 2021) TaxID=1111454 RepID=U7UN78_9FIRM|nr:hypothetical protein HMPREF1250_0276 [Megasphaera vaginalis (ex Srinivasan et al. 2021)]
MIGTGCAMSTGNECGNVMMKGLVCVTWGKNDKDDENDKNE